MADHPKSFWHDAPTDRVADPAKQWISALDPLGLRDEADIIRTLTRHGVDLDTAERRELWELAAACNIDLIETAEDKKVREQAEAMDWNPMNPDTWEDSLGAERLERLRHASDRRRGRKGRGR